MFKTSLVQCLLLFLLNQIYYAYSFDTSKECPSDLTIETYDNVAKQIVPPLTQEKSKGDAGKIGIIGGSVEYTGAPYFAAISAMKIGADLVYVVTTESAAPVIKSYSPDLIVYPYLSLNLASKINSLISKMDVVVIGPGLGREEEAMTLTGDIIETCKTLRKPLVIDADGLYGLSKNPALIKDYPSPGVILTPNLRESNKLKEAVGRNDSTWYTFWGKYVSVLIKGASDEFYSGITSYNWSSSKGGSGRRAAGQGDILSGSLGTLLNWTFKNYKSSCSEDHHVSLLHSIATYAVARFTRTCNSKAFELHRRSMTASDMIGQINKAFEETFE